MTKVPLLEGKYVKIYKIDLSTFQYVIEVFDNDKLIGALHFTEEQFSDILNWKG